VRLCARVAVTLIAVSVPLVAGARWWRGEVVRRAAVSSLAALARARMESGGRAECESSPETFRDPPRANEVRALQVDAHAARETRSVGRAPDHAVDHAAGLTADLAPGLALRGPAAPSDALDASAPSPSDASTAAASSLQELASGAPAHGASHTSRESASVREGASSTVGASSTAGVLADRALLRDGERQRIDRDSARADRDRARDSARTDLANDSARPRLEMFAYSRDFVSANPAAPPFPADLRRALESGARESGDFALAGGRRDVTAAVRMDWSSGPCAIVLAWSRDDLPSPQSLDEIGFAAIVAAGLVVAVLIAIVPIERRMRRLTDNVQRSAAEHYRRTVPVEGTDEIGALARAFNAAGSEVRSYIEELEKRERSLRDFVQNTTHDVMLPLTVLQGHLTQVRDVLASGGMPDRKTVRDALEESHYLASLVQNLVAAARLETGTPDRRHDAFVWNQLVERVVQRHGPIAREKGVELDFAAPENEVLAEGDVTLVEQALSNVVHNAVRYIETGGHVAVLLDAFDGRFSVRVFDDGPGVDESELARIAERSFRSDAARARHPDGMGLGLTIAKDVADQHGFTFVLRRAETGGLEVEIGGPALTAWPAESIPAFHANGVE
jgi:signal transduction histidine kinase